MMDENYPPQKQSHVTWEIFTQEQLTIPTNGTKTVLLGLGFIMTRGMIFASLTEELR